MLTSRSPGVERRGIVLVLVLAMLGLLALVGVTFATYAAQSKISNKGFMLSLFQPQAEELIDFGLSQLITDTNDIRSVIRGHSLARDMYGNDATGNALLGVQPHDGAGVFDRERHAAESARGTDALQPDDQHPVE